MRVLVSPQFRWGVVLLAAGASSRMGRPKLVLPWGSTSVLGHLIAQWQQVGSAQIAVVLAFDHQALVPELDRLAVPQAHRIINPAPERGMFSSIQCAAQWSGWDTGLTHWAIVLGDQPQIPVELLHKLLQFAAAHPGKICQPSRDGHPRHPVFLPRDAFSRLAQSNQANLKEFLQEHPAPVALCAVENPALDLDLDTPADYEEATRRFLE